MDYSDRKCPTCQNKQTPYRYKLTAIIAKYQAAYEPAKPLSTLFESEPMLTSINSCDFSNKES